MIHPRPSLTALRAFDAVSRHLSFKRAARYLGVTPTAVSHQIRQLEDRAGVRLFERGPTGVEHTAQGKAFAEEVGAAFDQLDRAYLALTRAPGRIQVVLGAGPVIASRWLAPKLMDFAARHPDIDLQLINSPTEIWRRVREFDLAIAWGHGDWPALRARKLLDVSLVPVLAPALARDLGALASPDELLRAPLLHHGDTEAWTNWFSRAGINQAVPTGTLVEDTNVAVQAALAGTGVMLGIKEFLVDDLASGRLLCPFEIALVPSAAYYLVSDRNADSPVINTLESWLLSYSGR